MKLRALVPVLFASILLFLQGCNDEKGLYELFSGTLPRFEFADGDGSRHTNPESLFFTMKGNAVELEGEVYPVEIISDDEESITYSATIPINSDLTVSGLSYMKSEGKLHLQFAGIEKELILEGNAEYFYTGNNWIALPGGRYYGRYLLGTGIPRQGCCTGIHDGRFCISLFQDQLRTLGAT